MSTVGLGFRILKSLGKIRNSHWPMCDSARMGGFFSPSRYVNAYDHTNMFYKAFLALCYFCACGLILVSCQQCSVDTHEIELDEVIDDETRETTNGGAGPMEDSEGNAAGAMNVDMQTDNPITTGTAEPLGSPLVANEGFIF